MKNGGLDFAHVTNAIIELLREVDSSQALLGKLYQRIFQVQEKLDGMKGWQGQICFG